MAESWIYVAAGNTSPLPLAPSFTQEDFHGRKLDARNNVPDRHTIAESTVRQLQAIADWTQSNFTGGVPIEITSTVRTSEFNLLLGGGSGNKGAHVLRIAADWTFTGPNEIAATKKFNTDIRDKGSLFQRLRSLGMGGIGLYGVGSRYGTDFCHIDSRDVSSGLRMSDIDHEGRPYEFWTSGMPRYEGDVDSEEESTTNINQTVGIGEKVLRYEHPSQENIGTNELFLQDLVKTVSFIGYGADANDILDFKHKGKTNRRRLYDAWGIEYKIQYSGSETGEYSSQQDYPITEGAVLYLPVALITIGKLEGNKGQANQSGQNIETYESNLTVEKTKESAFSPFVLRQLTGDPGYVPTYLNRGIVAQDTYPQLAVFAWSRTKYLEEPSSAWIDLTPYITSIDIGTQMGSGGNFSMTLSSPMADLVEDSENSAKTTWEPSGVFGEGREKFVTGNINKPKFYRQGGSLGEEYKRNQPYFDRIFQQNDLVFIRHERLEIEGEEDSSIADGWHDMIGLVDRPSTNTSAQNTDVTVTIIGRDFVKVLLDDNTYFNPYALGHSQGLFGDTPFANNRFFNGEFKDLSAIAAKTVKEQIEFIFHRIASIGYVPDDVFEQWKDKTQMTYSRQVGSDTVEISKTKGVWQIMKLWVDPSISDLKIVDGSVSNPNGSIFDLLNQTCQRPFVEFFCDTYGDKFYLMARKPPFEASTMRALLLESSPIDSNSTVGGIGNSRKAKAYSDYLSSLDQRKQDEATSLEGQKKEYLQITTDPLTNAEAKKYIDNFNSLTEDEQKVRLGIQKEIAVSDVLFPLMINVGENQIVHDDLRMSTEAYGWYEIENRAGFLGPSVALSQVPAVYFDKYAQIFGNRKLSVVSNYSNYKYFQDSNTSNKEDIYIEQASQLLAFLVETSIHLPFTREGTIAIEGGDRRIKQGYFILYRPTDEVFYVEGVRNNTTIGEKGIARTTTVQVSRGMISSYVNERTERVLGVDGTEKDIAISYFNLIDIPKLRQGIYDTATTGSASDKMDHKKDMLINEDVLNFFLGKKQFKSIENF